MRTCVAVSLALAVLTGPLLGQWSLTPEIGLTSFSGSGRDSNGLRMGPTRATALALRFGWVSPRLGFGVRVLTGSTGLGASDGHFTVIQEHQVRLFEVAGFVTWRVARLGSGSHVGLEAGPALEVWAPAEATTRSRLGAVAAALWAFPVSARLDAAVRFETALTPSLFDAADLPRGATRRPTWRRGVALALEWRR